MLESKDKKKSLLASQPCLIGESQVLMRDTVSKGKSGCYLRNNTLGCLLTPTNMHMHMQAHMHIYTPLKPCACPQVISIIAFLKTEFVV